MTDHKPVEPNDEVELCKGCNTMKHVNAEGFCGRCQPVDSDTDLRKQISDAYYEFCNAPIFPPALHAIEKLIATERQKAIDEIFDDTIRTKSRPYLAGYQAALDAVEQSLPERNKKADDARYGDAPAEYFRGWNAYRDAAHAAITALRGKE